jgi:hypothetical protein
MLARVVVDVIDMPVEICLITDAMFPITTLPNSEFVFAQAAGGYALAVEQGTGKSGFDQAPRHSEIGISGWQGTQSVQMVRQDHDDVDLSWMLAHDLAKAGAEQINLFG